MVRKLFEKIMARIAAEKLLLSAKRKMILIYFGIAGSLAGFYFAFKAAREGIIESGFLQFLSLIFSDFSVVVSNWQTFALSLLEAIPVVSLAMIFAAIFSFLIFIKFLAKYLKLIFNIKHDYAPFRSLE